MVFAEAIIELTFLDSVVINNCLTIFLPWLYCQYIEPYFLCLYIVHVILGIKFSSLILAPWWHWHLLLLRSTDHTWPAVNNLFMQVSRAETPQSFGCTAEWFSIHLRVLALCLVGQDVSSGICRAWFLQFCWPELCSHPGRRITMATGVQDRPLSRLDYQLGKVGNCQSLRSHKWLMLTACESVFCNLIASTLSTKVGPSLLPDPEDLSCTGALCQNPDF